MTDEHILTFFVSLFTKKMWCKWCSSEAPQIMSAFSFLDALEVSQQLTQSLTLSNDSEDNENKDNDDDDDNESSSLGLPAERGVWPADGNLNWL